MTNRTGMNKRTYLIVWTLIFALVLGMTGVANAVALYWDSALTIFFGEIGGVESAEGKDDTGSIYFPSGYTSSEERIAASESISNTIVAEGTVLLKNQGNVLPLKSGAKVSIFGIDAKDGSLGKAMEAAGYTVNPTLASFYAASEHSSGAGSLSAGNGAETGGWIIDEVPQSEYTAEVKSSYTQYADAAIVLLMRTGAEGNDLPYDMSRYGGSADEHYLELNQDEKDLLAAVGEKFETVIVLINSANAMQVDFVDQEEYGIDACLWHARCPYISIVGIISGSINPSGRLVDTYVADNMSSPAMQNFGDFRYVDESGNLIGQSYINYAEGIYVGYKYYETRYEDAVMGRFNAGDYSYADTVVYPFGYGLSYTSFEWFDFTVTESSGTYTASVTVKNTGSMAGKDVVEFYIQSPYIEGGVEKAAVSLVEYVKTKTLEPGETQTVAVTFSQQDIASYDYKNERTYILDAGDYYITAAKDAHDAINNVISAKGYSVENGMTANGNTSLVHKFTIAEKTLMNIAVTGVVITNQLDETLAENCEYLSRSDWSKMENLGLRYATGMAAGVSNVGNVSGDAPTYVASAELMANFALKGFAASGNPKDPDDKSIYPDADSYTYGAENRIELIDMKGLAYDDPKWEDLLDELKLSEMHALFNKSGWGNAAVESINKPKTYEYDAPHGIANFVTGEVLYSYPCATMLAATWNQELQEDYGVMIGNDAIATNTSGWYAPGINIHRTPFGARNYEYYSEDGVLTGLCSTAVTRGAESKGIHVYLKHFALNDQDTNRHANGGVTTWATEQAIREIYLKPFQMSIEDGGARGIMLTMSRVGWRYSCGSYPLMTAICRDEWGFTGCYITDYTTSMKGSGSDQYLAAGGNLVHATAEQTLSNVKSNWCRAEIRKAVRGILYNVANSLAMNGIEKGKELTGGFAIYKIILIAVDVLVGLCLAVGMFNVYKKIPMTEEEFRNRKRMGRKNKLLLWAVIAVLLVVVTIVFFTWAYPWIERALKI